MLEMFWIGLGTAMLIVIFHGKGGPKLLDLQNSKSPYDPTYDHQAAEDDLTDQAKAILKD